MAFGNNPSFLNPRLSARSRKTIANLWSHNSSRAHCMDTLTETKYFTVSNLLADRGWRSSCYLSPHRRRSFWP
jgi:hypothetical protein